MRAGAGRRGAEGAPAQHLTARLLEVARDFELANKAEKSKYESTILSLHEKLTSTRTSLELEKKRTKRQQELIDALQRQVHDSQLVETLQVKESLLEQGKLLKEVETLNAETRMLRFQLLDTITGTRNLNSNPKSVEMPQATFMSDEETLSGDEEDEEGENSDPNAPVKLGQRKKHLSYAGRLIDASRNGDMELVRTLLNPDRKVVETTLSSYRLTLSRALLAAAAGNSGDVISNTSSNADAVSLLLTCGADPFQTDPDSGWNAVHFAAHSGNDKVLEKLLLFGTNSLITHLEARSHNGQTAVHVAASACRPSCLRILLRNGAHVSLKDNDGNTPVDLALERTTEINESNVPSGTTPEDEALLLSANEHVKEQARQTLETLNDPNTLFWSYSVRANRLYGADDIVGAKEVYEEAILLAERFPDERITSPRNRATLYYNCARACIKVGSHSEAVKHCTTAIELRNGVYPNAMAQRALSYMELFEFGRAAQDYQQLLNQERLDQGSSDTTGNEDWEAMLQRAKSMDAKASDYYAVLEIPTEAEQSQIKQAFRKQCLRWHPDKHRKSEDDMVRASIRFKQINEANEVLSNERKRTLYDIDRLSKRMDDLRRQNKDHHYQEASEVPTEQDAQDPWKHKRPRKGQSNYQGFYNRKTWAKQETENVHTPPPASSSQRPSQSSGRSGFHQDQNSESPLQKEYRSPAPRHDVDTETSFSEDDDDLAFDVGGEEEEEEIFADTMRSNSEREDIFYFAGAERKSHGL
mmetsp:Transcript_11465/g.21242  ORF Transcript_11465/g.21242 Transcript_11465/m.21242 type:complete len:757 (+) Transcript_11465:274-2544(+)